MTVPLVIGELSEDFETKIPISLVATKLPISLDVTPVKLDVGEGKLFVLVQFSPQQERHR
jgi:hypothetical protein